MARQRSSVLQRRVAVVVGGAVTAVLAVLAARADSRASGSTAWMTVLDVMVGLAFIGAASWTPVPIAERVLIGGVGATWLAGSFLSGTQLVHQAVLIIVLVAFPTGRPRGVASWLFVGVAVVVAVKFVSQIGVVSVCAAVAATAPLDPRRGKILAWYRALAAGGIALALGVSWMGRRPQGE
jgi:hypothetical protein